MKEQLQYKPGIVQDRDLVIAEGCFELLKKKKNSQKQARKYQLMLENDYPGNKIIITAFQTGLLKCVQHLNKERKKKKSQGEDTTTEEVSTLTKQPSSMIVEKQQRRQSQGGGSGRQMAKNINKSQQPKRGGANTQTINSNAAQNSNLQNNGGGGGGTTTGQGVGGGANSNFQNKIFFMMEKDNAYSMFGYRIKYNRNIKDFYVENPNRVRSEIGLAELRNVNYRYDNLALYQTKRRILRPLPNLMR